MIKLRVFLGVFTPIALRKTHQRPHRYRSTISVAYFRSLQSAQKSRVVKTLPACPVAFCFS